jgi:peptidoglycan hydrolase FlgJ
MIKRIQGVGITAKEASLPRLKEVCAEFEALFLSQMLKTMRSSMAGGGVLGKSHQGEIYGSLMDEKMALNMSTKRGIGIGDILFKKLQGRLDPSD